MMKNYVFESLRISLLAAIGATSACGGTTVLDNGAAGSTQDGGAGSGGSGGTASSLCDNAQPILQPDGSETGFFLCPDGTKYRAVQQACDTTQSGPACIGDESSTSCLTDADCTDRPYGRCLHAEYYGPGDVQTSCGCSYSCASDADCDDGQICACSGVYGGKSLCIPASCNTNDDCLSGECGLSVYDDGCGASPSLHCRSADDACRTSQDCTQAGQNQCAVDYSSVQFACLGTTCAIGRPLLVDGTVRAARARGRADWSGDVTPQVEGLPTELRAALASRWSEVAAMEHASVASFARFTLQLMALGAPSDLLAGVQEAAADEVEHARMAYAVASAYAGANLGPDALDLTGVRIETDRATVLRGLIEEACVGEALGVAEARAYAESVTDPALQALLTKVADDEQRHAELAWRTLHWMLNGADEQTLAIARDAFEQATTSMRAEPSVTGPVDEEHGLWSADQIASLRRRTLDEVVGPCSRALLDDRLNQHPILADPGSTGIRSRSFGSSMRARN